MPTLKAFHQFSVSFLLGLIIVPLHLASQQILEHLSASSLQLEILGVIVDRAKPNNSTVLVKNMKTSKTQALKAGNTLSLEKDYILFAIHENAVDLLLNQEIRRYYKEGFVPVAARPVERKLAPVGFSGTYKEEGFERDKGKITISEEFRKKVIKDLPTIMMEAAHEVVVDANGNVIGFQLWEIEQNSIFQKSGLVNGDIIKSINGEELTNVQATIRILNSLKTADKVDVEIERSGQRLPMSLDIK
ncbi:MAG: PDZ domain-containing protein [Deltaproteobacteria bacterium]|nr:PDZ domain-containing protein [Deltaproteobacteria bacterium]